MKIKIKSWEEIKQNKPPKCTVWQANYYFAYFDLHSLQMVCGLWLTVANHDTSLLNGKHCYVITEHQRPIPGRIYIPDWFVEEVIGDENQD